MVDEAAKTGAIDEHASELASRALQFDRLLLRDVMIPRPRIDALPLDASADRIRQFMLEERRSRIPVYQGALDNIVGYVSAKDIVSLAWDGGPVVLPLDLCRTSATILPLESLTMTSKPTPGLAAHPPQYRAAP